MSTSVIKKALSEKMPIKITGNKVGRPVRVTKARIKQALRANGGFISYAAQSLGCNERTVRRAVQKWPDVAEELKDIRESHKDVAEHSLIKQIRKENTKATIFYLRHQGKDRGYGDDPTQHLHAHAVAGRGTWIDIIDRQIQEGNIDRHTGEIVEAEIVNGNGNGQKKLTP